MREGERDCPVCPGCGEPLGVYEPLLRVHPRSGAEPTSWLRLAPGPRSPLETLWHKACAELVGVDGG